MGSNFGLFFLTKEYGLLGNDPILSTENLAHVPLDLPGNYPKYISYEKT
jgi:hypothetical protein